MIAGIGSNVYDTLMTLPHFPQEDTKMRAGELIFCGGGPCGTGLVAAAKLGARSAYIGNLSDDAGGRFLLEDMERFGMDTSYVSVLGGYQSFLSYVLLNEENASRTCVAHRGNLPPLTLSDAQIQAVKSAQILMVDGNELDAAVEGAKIAKAAGTKVLYDAGGLYEGVERLLVYADILIPSEEFALGHTGEREAEAAAKKLCELYKPKIIVITQGSRGGILYDGCKAERYSSFDVDVKDSNGAGDVFHGAFAFGLSQGFSYEKCCIFASAASAVKCTKVGAREGAPTFGETISFLKERGIDV